MAMLLLVTIVSLYGASATSVLRGCRGVVSLDEDSFKKITNKFTTLVKFDKMNPYGAAHHAFQNVTERVAQHGKGSEDFIIGHVGVSQHGKERDNAKLAAQYGALDESKWPVYKMFHQNGHIVDFEGDNTKSDELAYFIQFEAGVPLQLPGTIDELNEIAQRFAQGNYDTRQLLLHEADTLAVEIVARDKSLELTVSSYIKIMRKIVTTDYSWLDTEVKRVTKLLRSKISDTKKDELFNRLKVLKAFQLPREFQPGTTSHFVEL